MGDERQHQIRSWAVASFSRPGWQPGWAASVVLVLTGCGCVLPARNYLAFESKAAESAASAVSDARTALLAATLAVDGRSLSTTISVRLADSATGAVLPRSSRRTAPRIASARSCCPCWSGPPA